MMLCDARIRARRISDGLPLVQPDILLPSDVLMQSFLAHDFVLADFIWTSFAPGTLSQLARNGTVLQRDIEVDNMAGYVVRGGSFDAVAKRRRDAMSPSEPRRSPSAGAAAAAAQQSSSASVRRLAARRRRRRRPARPPTTRVCRRARWCAPTTRWRTTRTSRRRFASRSRRSTRSSRSTPRCA
jgi:hypothetical protein